MIAFAYQKTRRLLILGIVGAFITITGWLIYAFTPLVGLVNYMVSLAPHSALFHLWSKPPYDVNLKVFIFNVTNAEAFLAGKEKLNVVEVGPYVYQETIINVNSVFNDNGTLTFQTERYLEFKRDRSIGDPKVDWIISPNIPLLGISSYFRDSSIVTQMGLANFAYWQGSKAVLNLTVDEYLWGYDDNLVTFANSMLPNWIDFKRFGILERLMALDNDTNTVTIRTQPQVKDDDEETYEDDAMLYSVTRYNGSPGLPLWGYIDDNQTHPENVRCNTIKGAYVEGIYPKDLRANQTIRMYRRAFCRPVDFNFDSYSEVKGLPSKKYKISRTVFETPDVNPDNACYCYKNKCPKKGLAYITPCYYGIPIVLSKPHFLDSDPELLEAVDGMAPNETTHETSFHLDQSTGAPLSCNLKIQINLQVDTKYSSTCRPFNGMNVPLFWLQLEIDEIPDLVVMMVRFIGVVPVLEQVLMWLFILLGPALSAAAALFFLYGPTNYGLEDPYNTIGYSPIRIVPLTQYLSHPPTITIRK